MDKTNGDMSEFENEETISGSRLQKRGIVLEPGDRGAWDAGMVESPMVWHDAASGRYAMVHTGYDLKYSDRRGYEAVGRPRIGLAWSDNLLDWERDRRSPVFGPDDGGACDYDCAGAAGPFIWVEDGLYYLYYFGTTKAGYEGGRKTLNLATSRDLVHWWRYEGNPVIEPAGEGWRRDAIWHPHIRKVAGTYYLFFNASGLVAGREEETIGYATSSDLREWRVWDEHCPLLTGSGKRGAWDSTGRAGDPSLFCIDGFWVMAYYSWDGVHTRDGLAMTAEEDFPLGWKPFWGNPVLRVGNPGDFDTLHAGKPHIFRNHQGHFHFYTAVDESERRVIALAMDL